MESTWIAGLVFIVCLLQSNSPLAEGKSFEDDLTVTYEQKLKLVQFKELVVSRMPHEWMRQDIFLIRWLRAREFNIRNAEKMLMNYVRWREENKMDDIFNEDWSRFRQEYRFYLDSRDKEGRPLLYLPAGEWDIRRAIISGQGPKLLRYIDMTLETACALVRELGDKHKNVSQGILLVNAQGFNLVQQGCIRCIPFLLRLVVAAEEHHPGCAEKIIVTNTPGIAEPLVNAVRGVLAKETNESLEIFGTNKNVWQRILLGYFDQNELPFELGGTKLVKGLEDDYAF